MNAITEPFIPVQSEKVVASSNLNRRGTLEIGCTLGCFQRQTVFLLLSTFTDCPVCLTKHESERAELSDGLLYTREGLQVNWRLTAVELKRLSRRSCRLTSAGRVMRETEDVIRTLVQPENYGTVAVVVVARSFVSPALSSTVRSFVRSFVRNLDLFRAITAIRVHLNNRSLIVIHPFPILFVPVILACGYIRRGALGNGECSIWAYIIDNLGNILRALRAWLTRFKFTRELSRVLK